MITYAPKVGLFKLERPEIEWWDYREYARVLDAGGNPVPGLYAAGESAGFGGGGMHGYRSLEGTFLGGCLFSGRTAGRAAARAVG